MITRIVLTLITAYQHCLSALMGSRCRFYPSCSQYTKEAIENYGIAKGCYMGSRRIVRCHPWHEGGYDPVPGITPVANNQDNHSQK